MFCTQCGNEVEQHARFCSKCGSDLTPAPAQPKAKHDMKKHINILFRLRWRSRTAKAEAAEARERPILWGSAGFSKHVNAVRRATSGP